MPTLIKSKNQKESSKKQEKTLTNLNSFLRASTSKLQKKITNNSDIKLEDIDKANAGAESLKSLERVNTFSRHLSSLKNKIFNSNKSVSNSQTNIIKPSITIDQIDEKKQTGEIHVTSSVTSIVQLASSTNKQLTISNLNSSKSNNNLDAFYSTNMNANARNSYVKSSENVLMPQKSSSLINSFTIKSKSKSNDDIADESKMNTTSGITNNINNNTIAKNNNNNNAKNKTKSLTDKKKSNTIFNLKSKSNKKSKTKTLI
jgi:hypothetical protein